MENVLLYINSLLSNIRVVNLYVMNRTVYFDCSCIPFRVMDSGLCKLRDNRGFFWIRKVFIRDFFGQKHYHVAPFFAFEWKNAAPIGTASLLGHLWKVYLTKVTTKVMAILPNYSSALLLVNRSCFGSTAKLCRWSDTKVAKTRDIFWLFKRVNLWGQWTTNQSKDLLIHNY